MANNNDKIEVHHPVRGMELIDGCVAKGNNYCRLISDGGVPAFELYDQVQIREDNELALCDIWLANGIGARIELKHFIELWKKREEIGEHLAKIPADVDLSDLSLDGKNLWKDLKALFNACRCRGISYSRMTKILHKKRPRLIPIVDDDVVAYRYLGGSWLGASDVSEYLVTATKHIQDDVVRNLSTLKSIQARLWHKKQIDLTLLRIFDILLYQHYSSGIS